MGPPDTSEHTQRHAGTQRKPLAQPRGLTLAGLLTQNLAPTDALLIFAALQVILALAVTLNRDLRRAGKVTEVEVAA